MASPKKSLSFRRDADGVICIHKKVKQGRYKSVADFWFEIKDFVKFEGELHASSGYIFKVHKSMGNQEIEK